mgnify:CR=1 FL=1|tara:strand:- start:49335 stop:49982 length:648 start_codon:yes stop_codon:yes gene_type:complete
MPTSHPFQLNEIVNLTTILKPTTVMEIGVGFGKYGLLLREYLEIWGEGEVYEDWLRKIDGIEIFEAYIMDHHRVIYDEIYIGNALDIMPERDCYDLILLIDVLEHIEYKHAINLLNICKQKAKHVIISTPKDIGHQGVGYDNIYESHLSQWNRRSLREALGSDTLFISNPHSHICLYSDSITVSRVKGRLSKEKLSFFIKRYFFPFYKLIKPKRN